MVAMITANSTSTTEATERVIDRLAKTPSNKDFLATLARGEV
jgi:transcription termination factor Rho